MLAAAQTGALFAKFGMDLGEADPKGYSLSLSCHRLPTAFYTARTSPCPKISGSFAAWLDGAGEGDKPKVDGHGRDKILTPLDVFRPSR
jgi:hypothetical protein